MSFATKVSTARSRPRPFSGVSEFIAHFSTGDIREDVDFGSYTYFFRMATAVVNEESPQGRALGALMNFGGLRRTQPLAFSTFDRGRIGVVAALRILDPASIRQQQTETCGPTALIIDLCRRDPVTYAQLVIDLAESGRARLGDIDVRPGTYVTQRSAGQIQNMAQADWVAIVSLRDTISGNLIDKIARIDGTDIWARGVTPSNIYDWLVACGYATVALIGESSAGHALTGIRTKYMRSTNGSLGGFGAMGTTTRDALALADLGIKMGWSVFLLITASLDTVLQAGTQSHEMHGLTPLDAPKPLSKLKPPTVSKDPLFAAVQASDARADRQKRLDAIDARRDQLNASLRKANESFQKSTDTAGHCMLLLDLEVGKYLVSCTVANRGKVMYHHSLPLNTFLGTLRAVVIASDR